MISAWYRTKRPVDCRRRSLGLVHLLNQTQICNIVRAQAEWLKFWKILDFSNHALTVRLRSVTYCKRQCSKAACNGLLIRHYTWLAWLLLAWLFQCEHHVQRTLLDSTVVVRCPSTASRAVCANLWDANPSEDLEKRSIFGEPLTW